MHFCTRFSSVLLAGWMALARLHAAALNVLILSDDEKLIGHFVRSNGGSVVFKSDILGELTIDWSKIKELHAAGPFAVVGKDLKVTRHTDRSQIPTGPLDMANQTITVNPGGAAKTIPVSEAAHVIDQATLDKAILHTPGPLEDWAGAVTAGATIVEATQNSRNFTGAINLVRAIPSETWLAPRNRTTIGFSVTDGILTQPNTPSLKTDIVHAAVEHDEYLHSDVYAFGQATFDHNYSQGLDLAQTYGGGFGWTAIKKANQTLDLSGSVNYVKQQFSAASSQNLAGSTFAEKFKRTLPHGIVFQEGISVTPTWSQQKDWMAAGTASVNVPVYKRLGFTINTLDSFLNDPPPKFRKNSFQVATGLTYTLR